MKWLGLLPIVLARKKTREEFDQAVRAYKYRLDRLLRIVRESRNEPPGDESSVHVVGAKGGKEK